MPFTKPLLALLLVAAPTYALDWSLDPVAQVRSQLDTPPPAAERLECRPEVIAAFQEAWRLGGSGREKYEAAFRIDRVEGGYEIVYMPMTLEAYQLPVQYYPGRTAAIVHTHPNAVYPTPGPGDYAPKVPNFVLSRRALYVTIPGTKKHHFVRSRWMEPCSA